MTDPHRLRRLDLNLLHSLDSLLREQNVTRAAAAVSVSQSVMSSALARLRRHFDDELLVRRDNKYALTPLARQLRPAVTDALQAVDRVVSSRVEFDPGMDSQVTVLCSELVAAMLLPPVRRQMIRDAPASTLRIIEPGLVRSKRIEESLAENVDGVFFPHGWISGLESIDVLHDQWVFVVGADNPVTELTLADLQIMPWLVAQVGDEQYHRGMQQVLSRGIRPRIDVTVSGSMSMPFFLNGSDRIAIVGRRLVDDMGELYGVREVPGPFELEGLLTAFWWHASRRDDPVHRWFRSLLAASAVSDNSAGHQT